MSLTLYTEDIEKGPLRLQMDVEEASDRESISNDYVLLQSPSPTPPSDGQLDEDTYIVVR